MQELKLVNKYAENSFRKTPSAKLHPRALKHSKHFIQNRVPAMISSAGSLFPQIMIKKNSQESKGLPNISKRIRIFLLLSVSAVRISARERYRGS